MSDPMRVAIVGCGGMARTHARSYVAMPGVRLVALADIRPDALQDFAQAFEIPAERRFTDYAKMYETVRPDIVAVVTRPRDHHGPTVAALERGIHVLCEKPIAMDLVEADEMIATSERTGAKLAVNTQRHTDPVFLHAAKLVRDGKIGDLRALRAECKSYKAGYGMMNIGSHYFDAMGLFAGEATWVFASLTMPDGRRIGPGDITEGERDVGLAAGEVGVVQIGYRNGVTGVGEFWEGAGTFGFEVVGTKGLLALRGGELAVLFTAGGGGKAARPIEWEVLPVPLSSEDRRALETDRWSTVPMMRSLVAAIREDQRPPCSGYEGRASLEIIMAAYLSERTGCRVPLPLAERRHVLELWRAEAMRGR